MSQFFALFSAITSADLLQTLMSPAQETPPRTAAISLPVLAVPYDEGRLDIDAVRPPGAGQYLGSAGINVPETASAIFIAP